MSLNRQKCVEIVRSNIMTYETLWPKFKHYDFISFVLLRAYLYPFHCQIGLWQQVTEWLTIWQWKQKLESETFSFNQTFLQQWQISQQLKEVPTFYLANYRDAKLVHSKTKI